MEKILRRLLAILKSKKLQYTVGIILGLFVLFNYILLPLYVNHGSILLVPKVTGLSTDEAHRVLIGAGLEPVDADTRSDPEIPLGGVVNQNPAAGAKVKYGRRVYLTISGGEALVSVPLLRGRSTRDAKFALERNGLRLGAINYASSESFPENTIMDQSAPAQGKVPKGSAVGITVSRGRLQAETTVPLLVGKTVSEAEKILLAAGLKVGNITYQLSFDLIPNTVVEQFPRASEPVQQGQAVDLFVVKMGKPTEEIQTPTH